MNHLPVVDDSHWDLPLHAHIIVHETEEGNGLLTIYDCGAAQKPPAAQLIGTLVHVDAEHVLLSQPHGYIVKLRETALLEQQEDEHYVVRASSTDSQ